MAFLARMARMDERTENSRRYWNITPQQEAERYYWWHRFYGDKSIKLYNALVMYALADPGSMDELCQWLRSSSETEVSFPIFSSDPEWNMQPPVPDPDMEHKFSRISQALSEARNLNRLDLTIHQTSHSTPFLPGHLDGMIQILQGLTESARCKIEHLKLDVDVRVEESDEDNCLAPLFGILDRLCNLKSIDAHISVVCFGFWRRIAQILLINRHSLQVVSLSHHSGYNLRDREDSILGRSFWDAPEELLGALRQLESVTTMHISGFVCMNDLAYIIRENHISNLVLGSEGSLETEDAFEAFCGALGENKSLETFTFVAARFGDGVPLNAHESLLLLNAAMTAQSIKSLQVSLLTASEELFQSLKNNHNESNLDNLSIGFTGTTRFSDFVRMIEDNCVPRSVKKINCIRGDKDDFEFDEPTYIRLSNAMKSNFSLHFVEMDSRKVGIANDDCDAARRVCFYLVLNRMGRGYLENDKANHQKGAQVLLKVSKRLNPLYLHLLETPNIVGGFQRESEVKDSKEDQDE